jgi:branched-chain amino acid aminotransferase
MLTSLPAFRNPEGEIQIFRPDFHATRFAHSSSFVSIPSMSNAFFIQCVELAVSRNAEFVPPHDAEALMYIRPVVFGSGPQISLAAPSEFIFCVYAMPGNSYHGIRPLDALVMEEFDRAAPKGTGSAKVGGNYAPVIRWQAKAMSQGFPLTLHLDSKTGTEIEEFSTSAFIGVIAGEEDSRAGCRPTRLVLPDSQNIIDSVTSDSCAQIAKSLGWIVEKRAVRWLSLIIFRLSFLIPSLYRSPTIRSTNSARSWLPVQRRRWSPSAPSAG